MGPLAKYQQDIELNGFSYDAEQEKAIKALQDLYERLLLRQQKNTWYKSLFNKKQGPEQGLYFWGGVGRGKTYLMDIFYDALPFEQKLRTHFHRFMKSVHEQLVQLSGKKNPLETVADDFAKRYKVLCFDEFFVSDIGDAMILGTLMQHLFTRGITLVTTSNIVPNGLYKDGLQRKKFLPAIAMLEQHTKVMNVDAGIDYRLRTLEQAQLYHYPHSQQTMQALDQSFMQLAADQQQIQLETQIEVLARNFTAKKLCEDIIWFDFYEICDGPRSQNDYIELSRIYQTVIISNVPQFGAKNDDLGRRFIYLVDEFYDRNIKLLISAQVSIADIYSDGKLNFEFERTQSRLLEMQSTEYLGREHISS